jgi:hypothetical protein
MELDDVRLHGFTARRLIGETLAAGFTFSTAHFLER